MHNKSYIPINYTTCKQVYFYHYFKILNMSSFFTSFLKSSHLLLKEHYSLICNIMLCLCNKLLSHHPKQLSHLALLEQWKCLWCSPCIPAVTIANLFRVVLCNTFIWLTLWHSWPQSPNLFVCFYFQKGIIDTGIHSETSGRTSMWSQLTTRHSLSEAH